MYSYMWEIFGFTMQPNNFDDIKNGSHTEYGPINCLTHLYNVREKLTENLIF